MEEITKKSIRESLIANRDLADLSKALATIRTDCDVELDFCSFTKDSASLRLPSPLLSLSKRLSMFLNSSCLKS